MFFREWFAVFCLFCFAASLFFVANFSSNPTDLFCKTSPLSKIQVEVLGAVERPGVYEVEVGSSIRSILAQAGIKKTADRQRVNLKKKLLTSCRLNVPEKNLKKSKKKKESSSSISFMSYVT